MPPLIWGLFGVGAILFGGAELADALKDDRPAFDPVPTDDFNTQVSQAAIIVGLGALGYYVTKG